MRTLLLSLAVSAALLAAGASAAQEPVPVPTQQPRTSSITAEGLILVKYAGGADTQEITLLNAMYGTEEAAGYEILGRIGVKCLRTPEGVKVSDLVQAMNEDPSIEYAEPNGACFAHVQPNDTYYATYQQWYYDLVNAPWAWDTVTGCADVIVAICDTGVDLDHPDLAAHIWVNTDEIPGNGVDDDGNGFIDDRNGMDFAGADPGDGVSDYPPDNNPDVFAGDPSAGDGTDNDGDGYADDGVFHGTFVAGVVGAVGNNATGVSGGAWTITLMPVRMGCAEGYAWYSDMASAFIYAADNGARIINCSFGGAYSYTIRNAVNYATGKGVVFVASAGNGNTTPVDYPAANPNAIAVGASDHDDPDGRASFSNWGTGVGSNKLVEAVAPGVDNVSTGVFSVYDENQGWGPAGGASYFLGSGTSFSAPIVTAAIALHFCQCPYDGYDDVWAALPGCTNDLPDDPDDSPDAGATWDGWGMIDYSCLVESCLAAPEFTVSCPADTFGDHWWDINFPFRITNTGTAPAAGFTYRVSETPLPCWGPCQSVYVSDSLYPGESYVVDYLVHVPDTASVGIYRDIQFAAGPCGPGEAGSDSCVSRVTSTGPTAISFHSLRAESGRRSIDLSWEYSGSDLSGFNIYRRTAAGGKLLRLNGEPVPATGTSYRFTDRTAKRGERYFYIVSGIDAETGAEKVLAELSQAQSLLPIQMRLYQNTPNPFSGKTSIGFDLPERSMVSMEIYDVRGRRVAILENRTLNAGTHSVEWTARGADGRELPAGIYFCRMSSAGRKMITKMVVTR